jgi:hypothetical protein
MGGITGTVNGTVTSVATGVINDTAASFQTATNGLANLYLYILSGPSAGSKRKIVSNTATQITYDNSTALILTAGVRYAVAPVYFEVRYWPLTLQSERALPRSLFTRWIITSMGVCTAYLAGEATAAIQKIFVGTYRNFGEDFANTLVEAPLLTDNPTDSRVYFNVDGVVLEPGLKQIASDVDFAIAGILTNIKFTSSTNAK